MKRFICIILLCAIVICNFGKITVNAESIDSKLKSNQAQQEELDKKIEDLNEKTSKVQDKINDANDKIQKLNEESKQLEEEIKNLKENIKSNEENLGERLKVINNNYTLSYLKVILNSDSISGFLNNIYIVQEVIEQDKQILQDLENDKTEIEENKKILEENKEEEKVIKEELEKDKKSLDEDKEELEKLKAELVKEEEELEAELQKIATDSEISGNSSSSGQVISNGSWPVPGYSRVSSPFGYRIHPILGVKKLHTGIDIPAPTGTSAVAVESGTVIFSGTQGSYGKTVMIRHNNGQVSLYAHNSELLVKVGDTVKKGQVVTKIGSTGRSTGPHLHFEIRVNGTPKNPLNYL